MDTSTMVIGGAILAVAVVGVVLITREPPTTVYNQQPVQQGNTATSVAQGITQGVLGFLSNALSRDSNTPDRQDSNRGSGAVRGTGASAASGIADAGSMFR